MAYPPLNTAIQTTIACGHFFSGFFLHAQHRGSRSTKTEKTKKKQAEAENNEFKTKTGGGGKLRIFSENRGRPVALSQKTEGGPSRVECDLARLLRFEWRYLVAEIQPIGCGWG